MKDRIYQFIIKVQAIAKIGLLFTKDDYARENYAELETLSKSIIEECGQIEIPEPNYFIRNIYPTPNISVRALCFNEHKQILFVKEKNTASWSLPGGWCDLFETPSAAIVKEVSQEAGFDVRETQLLGITDRAKYKYTNSSEYSLVFLVEIIKNNHQFGHEISDVEFFDLNDFPNLSNKTTIHEIHRALESYNSGIPFFD